MKISVLTPTYNRAYLLPRLYESLLQNKNDGIEIEWLIMDDGSNDETKNIVEKWQEQNQISIQYNYQENRGKMISINRLVQKATGDLIVDCDSDDYFTKDAFQIIRRSMEGK